MAGILIIGGYGHVGRQIAQYLAQDGRAGVRIGGRDASRLAAVAGQLGCEWVTIDLNDSQSWDHALAGIETVLVCLDVATDEFPAHVLKKGLAYIDISATDDVLRRIEALDALARAHDGRAVLSVGLAPGLSNLMARTAAAELEHIEALTIGVLLGLGSTHGPAAVNWTLDNLEPLAPGDVEMLRFGPEGKPVATMPFDFADQHVLARRQGLSPVVTRLGLDSPLMTRGTLRLLSRLASKAWFRRLLHWSMTRFQLGSDRASLVVAAKGQNAGNSIHRRLTLDGRDEAAITALVAANVALMLPGSMPPGVWHIDEIWQLSDFAPALRHAGVALSAPDGDGSEYRSGPTEKDEALGAR